MNTFFGIGAVLVSMLAAGHAADPVTLLPGGASGKFFVPADGALGTNWIAPSFDDAGWSNVTGAVGFDLSKAPVLAGGVIADSVAAFSGVQGSSNWFYGYWDKANDSDGTYQTWDFIAFPREAANNSAGTNNFWDGAKWHWFDGNPPWDELSANGGRSSGSGSGPAHYVIRRWVSEVSGLAHLVGNISHDGGCGDGVDLRIWVDGVEVLGLANVFGTNAPFAVNVDVQIGSTVDFAVGANDTNDACDTFGFSAKVLQNTLADSVVDFAGVQGARGWNYGYYNKSADGDGIYNPASDFNSLDPNLTFDGAWKLGPGDPPGTMIGQTEMRPNSGPEHWAIRRYTSTHAGPVRIAGALTIFQACGGGTRARIFLDGVQIFSRNLSQTSVGYSVLANVSVGSRIDFALDPNGDDGCDGTTWTATIQPAAVSSMLVADSEAEFSGTQGQDNWFYGYYNRTADADATYNPATDFNRTDPNWTFSGAWTLGPGDPPWETIGRLDIQPNGVNDGAEHWPIRRWVSKVTGAITVDWHFSKSNSGGEGSTLLVFQNGRQVDAATIAGDDLIGVTRVLNLDVRQGDRIDFAQTPVGPEGDAGDAADGSLFNARIHADAYNPGAICTQVADSQADWSATGQQGFRGWHYGFYNKTADATSGYQTDDFTQFPHDGGGWSPTDFWDGGSWNWSPDPAPWDNIGKTFVIPNGTNTFISEEHWVIRRWVSAVTGTLRIDWFTRKVNPFGNGVTGKILHNGVEKDAAATADQTGFRHTLTLTGVIAGDAIDLALTPVGPGSDGNDGADGSDNGMTIYACTNVSDCVTTDVAALLQNVNASAYLRERFVVPDVSCLDQVRLRMKYDDGFVAWLNGVEVARRNAFGGLSAPAWNSHATGARATTQAVAPEVVDLTPFKSALVSGVNVLAIHGLNRGIDDSDFLLGPEITATVLPPQILAQPRSRTNLLNETASFQVLARTCAAASYQWRSNATPIPGATQDTILIGAQLANQAGYDVILSNAGGSVTSVVAILTVNRHPVALANGVATPMNTPVLLPVRKLLNNDSDPDGDPFSLTSIASTSVRGGTALLSGTNVLYTPPGGFTGDDSFTYALEDGRGGTATGTVQVFVYSGALPTMNQVMLQLVPGGLRVRFAGIPGKSYQVQRTADITQPIAWTTIQSVTAPAHGMLEYTDISNLPFAFYRTMLAP